MAIEKAMEGVDPFPARRMSLVEANWEIYNLLKDDVKVTVTDSDDEGETVEDLKVIDWENIENNDFFLVSQFSDCWRDVHPQTGRNRLYQRFCRWC